MNNKQSISFEIRYTWSVWHVSSAQLTSCSFSLRTLDTVATFYGVNFKLYNFFCKIYMLCRIYLDIRICKKRGVRCSFCREKCFKSDFALTLLRKKSFSIFHWRTKIFWVITTSITHSNS